jgi:signal transduction histidine kinase
VNLDALIKTVAQEWAPLAEQLSLRLRATPMQPSAPLIVLADHVSLLRLLRIWLDNACKFTPRGGSIDIKVQATADTVFMAVEDSGVGIAAEDHKRIFDRFYRVSGDTGGHASGAGLGLSLAAWIAEQHKTCIKVVSALGRGSRFEISLLRLQNETVTPAGNSPQESIGNASARATDLFA